MTYQELIIQKNNLDRINFIADADPRFLYAVSKNKARLESIVKLVNKMVEQGEAITEYRKELDTITKEFAEKDADGTIAYLTIKDNSGSEQKAYKKVIGEGNASSAYSKKVEKLKDKYKSDLDEYEARIKSFNTLLETEVPEDEYRKFMIDIEIVPKGLHPLAMDGCYPFIKEVEEDELKVKK